MRELHITNSAVNFYCGLPMPEAAGRVFSDPAFFRLRAKKRESRRVHEPVGPVGIEVLLSPEECVTELMRRWEEDEREERAGGDVP